MHEQIDDLVGQLTEVRNTLAELAEVKAALEVGQADLASIQSAVADAKDELAIAKRGLTSAQFRDLQSCDQAIFAKSEELDELTHQFAKLEPTLAPANAKLAAAQAKHDAMLNDLYSVRQRFAEAAAEEET